MTAWERMQALLRGEERGDPGDGGLAFPWPGPMAQAAFHGLAGDVVRVISPHSEADPVALLVNTLVAFGSVVGSRPHFRVEADRHRMRLFAALVGETAKARKGTSWGHVRHLFEAVDPSWPARVMDGLSSGEGLIWQVRDPIVRLEPRKEGGGGSGYEEVVVDPGVSDKRLLVMEGEFARVLRVLGRDGNTLSAVVRNAWDTGDLRTLTKNFPATATGAHISILGHITRDELLRYLSSTESANGFGNRFLWFCVARSKALPFGGGLQEGELEALVHRLRDAVAFARDVEEVTWSDRTRPLWAAVYEELSEGRPGLVGAMIARGEAQVSRLASLYALLDGTARIEPVHLEAALAVWDYAEASARYIFQAETGNPVADELWRALQERPEGMSRTEIRDLFGRHRSRAEVEQALDTLRALGRVRKERVATGGRPREVWMAVTGREVEADATEAT